MNRFNTKGKRTYNISEIIVGDIVKFKGTRNGGVRRVLEIYESITFHNPSYYDIEETIEGSFFCKVLNQKMSGFSEEPYTSTNSVDKLSHVFRDGTWFKVIKD
mgnify:CR=1 FL=1